MIMQRYEDDDIDTLGCFTVIGLVAVLSVAFFVFILWMGWV